MRRNVLPLAMLAAVAFTPAMLLADDQEIAEAIVERLSVEQEMGRLHDFDLDLQVEEGQVWMTGQIADTQQQQLVLGVAARVPGVTRVVNDLSLDQETAAIGPGLAPAAGNTSPPQRSALVGNRNVPMPPASSTNSLRQASRTDARSRGLLAGFGSALKNAMGNRDNNHVQQVANEQPLGSSGSGISVGPAMPMPNAYTQQSVGTGVPSSGSSRMPRAAAMQQGRRPAPGAYGPPAGARNTTPLAFAPARVADARAAALQQVGGMGGAAGMVGPSGMVGAGGPQPVPSYVPGGGNVTPATYDHPYMPNYAWPSYASYPNYAALTYPRQYSPTAWPYIGPFYPYPQVPLGWRKVTLEWDDGWWMLDFNDGSKRRLFRH